MIVLIIAILLALAVWYQQRLFSQSTTALSNQLQVTARDAISAGEQAQQALKLAQTQAGQISELNQALQDSRDAYQGLEKAFQTLTDSSSDLVLLNDIDHLLTIASQQLSLGGNVSNAIIALEAAQAQLARANRPSLAPLQQAINGDVDRLRAVAVLDVAQLSGRLDELKRLVSQAPLLIPDDAAPQVESAPRPGAAPVSDQGSISGGQTAPEADAADAQPWWRETLHRSGDWLSNAWASVRQDLGGFISVRRVQDSSALLISPDQAVQLRENLRLRIMTAQLALMMRQPEVWKSETDALVQALESHFDGQSPQVKQAIRLARQLSETPIAVKAPTVDNSIQALEALRQSDSGVPDEAQDASSVAPADASDDPAPGPANGSDANGAVGASSALSSEPVSTEPNDAKPQE